MNGKRDYPTNEPSVSFIFLETEQSCLSHLNISCHSILDNNELLNSFIKPVTTFQIFIVIIQISTFNFNFIINSNATSKIIFVVERLINAYLVSRILPVSEIRPHMTELLVSIVLSSQTRYTLSVLSLRNFRIDRMRV